MEEGIIFRVEGDILIAVMHGEEKLEKCKRELDGIMAELQRLDLNKVLVDLRLRTSFLSVMQDYEFARYAQEMGYAAEVTMAAVCQPEYMEQEKFWETASRNREMRAQVFSSMEPAMEWLQSC